MTSPPSKTRSPNYPVINLSEAIERVKVIYEKQRKYPATREVIAKLLGYGSLNGASAPVVSALSKYGLLEGHGDQLKVSSLGEDLALYRPGDPQYRAALELAAFTPAFFRDLRDQFTDGLPHDHTLHATLIKRGFNPKAIDGAIRSYRETMEILDTSQTESSAITTQASPSTNPAQAPSSTASPEKHAVAAPTVHDPTLRAVNLPLTANEWATLYAPFPIDEPAWNQMLAVLNAMKPALVRPDEVESTPTGQPELA